MIEKKHSTRLSQLQLVGVKWMCTRGLRASQAWTVGCLWVGVVVTHHVQLDPGVGLGDLLEKGQELLWTVRAARRGPTVSEPYDV